MDESVSSMISLSLKSHTLEESFLPVLGEILPTAKDSESSDHPCMTATQFDSFIIELKPKIQPLLSITRDSQGLSKESEDVKELTGSTSRTVKDIATDISEILKVFASIYWLITNSGSHWAPDEPLPSELASRAQLEEHFLNECGDWCLCDVACARIAVQFGHGGGKEDSSQDCLPTQQNQPLRRTIQG